MDKSRGSHLGNFQIIAVGSNLIAPIITGFLLEIGQAKWSLIFSSICFLIGLLWVQKIKPTHTKIESSQAFKEIFQKTILDRKKIWGFAGEMVVGISMWILWPLYFKAVVGKYSVMGLLTAAMALIEIFVTRFVGKLTDKVSAKKMLIWGCWSRFIDLAIRASYIFFKPLWFVGIIQIMSTVLGPLFQISALSRVFEFGVEQHKDHLIDFFLARESFLGLSRFFFLVPVAGIVYLTDIIWLGLVFVFAGLWAFGLRRL